MSHKSKIYTQIDDYLLYRRQYFLGPKYIDHLQNWDKYKVGLSYYLTAHPDLDVTIINESGTTLTLLGFILDPYNPLHSNKDVLIDILSKSHNFSLILKNSSKYGGRWILIHSNSDEINLFTDACSSRSTFYFFNKNICWCSSQPHTLANLLKLKKRNDKEFLEFITSKEFKKHENTLFGDDTLYKDIFHLLPNHFLSINKQNVKRFWPIESTKELSIKDAIGQIAPIIKGLYKSANTRFNLIQPLTAGRDTRLLLAASKDEKNDIYYFIQKFKSLKWFSKDINLPKKLMKSLDLEFHVEKCNIYNRDFDEYLRKNVYMIQSDSKKILHYNFFRNFQGNLNVSGNYSGIYRPFKWQLFVPSNTPLIDRTIGIYFKKYDYVVNYINNWEKSYYNNIAQFNYPIWDIFYWENKAANWVSMFLNELDIAIEEWCPVNNREILSIILSINPIVRFNEGFQSELVNYLWKETLNEPLAAPGSEKSIKGGLKHILYSFLKQVGLLEIVKKTIKYFN